MPSLNITNFSTTTVNTVYGPVAAGQTRNFANISQAAFEASLSALNTLVTAGTINYATVTDGTGLSQGADVQNVFGSIGVGTVPTSGGLSFNGNVTIVQPVSTEHGLYVFAEGTQGGDTNGLWCFGRPVQAGVGLQTIRWLYSSDSQAEHIVGSMESYGTFGIIGNGDYRARYECYDFDGQENPTFRLTTYPAMTLEMAQLPILVPTGSMVRSSNVVTVHYTNHGYEVGQVLSQTCGGDEANFPSALNAYTVASVPDANHFTVNWSGADATSTAPSQWSVEATCKLRVAGRDHLTLVMGPYGSEVLKVDWYDDSMVTAAGYGMSYGGSVLYQPTTVNHSASPYAMTAGSLYLCDATAGAITFNLPLTTAYDGKPGRTATIVKTDSSGNAVTVTAAGSDTISGASTFALSAQYNSVTVSSDGGSGNWYVTGSH